MKVKLSFFGILTEVVGSAHVEFETDATSSATLNSQLQHKYPELAKYSYKIAVNQEILSGEKSLNEGDEVAFLPPFSGG
jgi:molybdopterin synthase sulfur carrier subunit